MVVNSKSAAVVCGTRTTTVPVWPRRDGVATTDIAVVEPSYISVIVVNANDCCGTCTVALCGRGMMIADAPGPTDTSGIDGILGEYDRGASGVIGSTPGELLGSGIGTLHILSQYQLLQSNRVRTYCVIFGTSGGSPSSLLSDGSSVNKGGMGSASCRDRDTVTKFGARLNV